LPGALRGLYGEFGEVKPGATAHGKSLPTQPGRRGWGYYPGKVLFQMDMGLKRKVLGGEVL
jgi:hypothetical protein